jgi:hypothetical protein
MKNKKQLIKTIMIFSIVAEKGNEKRWATVCRQNSLRRINPRLKNV